MTGFTIRFDADDASLRLARHLDHLLRTIGGNPASEHIVTVCVGTDRATGDALGPIVGTHLTDLGVQNVYGTLADPVHAGNLTDTLIEIDRTHKDPFVIAVDASLSTTKNVGNIDARVGSLRPGLGAIKRLPPVGNIHIVGAVNVGGFREYEVLQNTRLYNVMRMGAVIARAVYAAVQGKVSYQEARCEVI